MDIKLSKSLLAKLLAQEDITVIHAKAPTASFDTEKRVLTLPIWKEMDGDLYDLLVGHEVGHAEFTPPEGWHNAICGPDGDAKNADHAFKSFLNVLEDARIEKKIKSKFPGLRANFYRAYNGLHERDFFEVKDKNIAGLMFIDRINLHFKLGSFVAVPFSEEEKVYIRRIENLDTWEEVETIARELYTQAKQDLKEGKRKIKLKLIGSMKDSDGQDPQELDFDLDDVDEIEIDIDFDDTSLTSQEKDMLGKKEPMAETDTAFREKEAQLLDETSRSFCYYTVPDFDSRKFIITHKQIAAEMTFTDLQINSIPETLQTFRRKNDKFVNYLVKEFELKRNAQQQARAKVGKSGELDMKKVYNYRLSEDLFRRFTTVPNGKNHGLIMFFDMSGSMTQQMAGVIEQMIVLVEFCRKVNIPFEVYGFTNNAHDNDYVNAMPDRESKLDNEVMIQDAYFSLRQYFTDTMRPNEYKTMLGYMLTVARIYRARKHYRHSTEHFDLNLPNQEQLNGTPLNPALLVSMDVYNRFMERTKAEIVNMVILTDGESDDSLRFRNKDAYRQISGVAHPSNYNVFLTHALTRKSVKVDAYDGNHTRGLVKLIGDVTGANMICFDLVENTSRRMLASKMFKFQNWYEPSIQAVLDSATRQFKRDRIFVIENRGWSEHYLILGGDALNIDEEEIHVETGAGRNEILKAFNKMQNNKQQNRVLLNRFIKMIA